MPISSPARAMPGRLGWGTRRASRPSAHARDKRGPRQAAARWMRPAWGVDGQEAKGTPEVIREASTQRLADALFEFLRGKTPRKPVAAEETDRVLPVLIRHEERFHAAPDGSGEREVD